MSSDMVLVLNSDGNVWDVKKWQNVYSNIILPLCKNDLSNNMFIAENFIWSEYPNKIKTAGGLILPRPAVIYLPMYIPHSRKSVRFSRWNVFIRDRYCCMYCGIQCGYANGMIRPELEHIVPKKLGGKSTFENTVTACTQCNAKKRDMTAEDFAKKFGYYLKLNNYKPSRLHPVRFLKYINKRNVSLWLNKETNFIPDAKFYASVMFLREETRRTILNYYGENDED
jgi:hypothetical protein